MKLFGLCMVRDEPDIIRISVRHHLAAGVDHILLVDNGSSDETIELVEALGRSRHVTAWRDDSEWKQAEMLTELAREAGRRGADWVIPFDADEFWVARGTTLRALLAGTDAGALQVPVINFVQARSRRATSPENLLSMTRRVERPVGPFELTRELVESREIAFVEMMYPPKYLSRVTAELEIGAGNHTVEGLAAPSEATDVVGCLHAPLRSWASLDGKAERGLRQDAAGWPSELGWHARRFGRLRAEGRLEEEWRANTYGEDGSLDVFGTSRGLLVDRTLAELVKPLLETDTAMPPPQGALRRFFGRGRTRFLAAASRLWTAGYRPKRESERQP